MPWWAVLYILMFAGIGLVGLNMMIQGKRNRPGAEGFFYSFLGRLTRRSTPVHATLVPLVIGLLAVLEGTLRRNRAATEFGVVAGLTWVSLFVQLFVHEVGHLLAVRRVGLPFVRLAAGPLALFPHGRGYRLAANRDWLHFMLGVVEYGLLGSPSARKTLFVASAGPIATAFLGLFALAAEESFLADGGSSLAVAQANAAIAGGILLVNLIPLRFGHMESDGLQIWLALRSLAGRR